LRDGGFSEALSVARHGIRWRTRRAMRPIRLLKRRAKSRARRALKRGGHALLARAGAAPPPKHTPISAPASLAAAEAGLQELDVTTVPPPPPREAPPQLTVGVVVPAFHDTAYLPAALASVAQQTHTAWTCVVVDDGSSEDVGATVQPFVESDNRFRLVRHGANGGLSAARNTGLRELTSDLVVFLDADDMLCPRALEHGVATMRRWWHDDAVAGAHGQILQVPDETDLSDVAAWTGRYPRSNVAWPWVTGECPFNVHAAIVRRSLASRIGGFDESFVNGAEDWDLWLRILRHGYRFQPTGELAGAYRQRSASMIRRHHAVHLERASTLMGSHERWARVDPDLVAGLGAAAPAGRGRLAHARAQRAAGLLGMQVAAERSLEPLESSSAWELVDLDGLCEGRRHDLVAMATTGLLRGFGVSRPMLPALSDMGRAKLEATADLIADAIVTRAARAARESSTSDGAFNAARHLDQRDVVVCAESAADVRVLAPIVAGLDSHRPVAAIDLETITGDSGARSAWLAAGIEVVSYHHLVSAPVVAPVLVAVDPPGPVTLDLIARHAAAGSDVVVVRPDHRPGPLPCDPASKAELVTVDAEGARQALREGPARGNLPAVAVPSRETFSAALPREDGRFDQTSIEGLRRLEGRHAGETCVIIGNGPSLNETDLGLLDRVPTFGVNGIFLAYDRLPRPLTFYVVEDTAVFRENLDAIKAVKADWKLFPAMYRSSFTDDEVDERTLFFRMNAGFYGRRSGTDCHPRFSTDATQRLYCGQSVTIINLQLAYWMGFQRVVLIGMDFSYTIPEDADRKGDLITSRSDDPNHFHPDYFGAGRTWKDPHLDRVLASYRLAKEMYEADGREIVNATVGGHLELFPRQALVDALNVTIS
jgi:GT2 family glycosyltransferase